MSHATTLCEQVDKERLTQVGRALHWLGIEHIAAYSPEARGRSERMFGTLQDRLPKELKLARITDIKAANRFLAEVYLPAHNARFAKPPEIADSAFVAADSLQLAESLCVEEERVVARDTAGWPSSTARAASAVMMQMAGRSASRSHPCCTRARRPQGVAWKRRSRRPRQRGGQP
ncbi:MAG: hypothetical protein EOS85_33030 [Mesorhizobium sp.]|nr:MAG: hypothetical protein EOS85_33030 [Mesorhizobium sp.]